MNTIDAPTGRYDYAYQQATGTLMVHAVTVRDLPIEYQIYGDKIYADTSPTDVVIADYTYRANEEDRPRTSRLPLSMHWQPCFNVDC